MREPTPEIASSESRQTSTTGLLKDRNFAADFWTILSKYGEAAAERDKIIALKANLEAREKWLAEHTVDETKAE